MKKRNYILMVVNAILAVVVLAAVWQVTSPKTVFAYDENCGNTCGSNKCGANQWTVDIMQFDANHNCVWVNFYCTDSCPAECGCGPEPTDPASCEPYCPSPTPPPPTATPIPPTPTPTPTPTPARVSVSGTVYDDPAGDAGGINKCIGPYGAPIKPGGGSVKVRVDPDEREGPVQGNGSYAVNQVLETGFKTITMQDYDPQYQCTCPTGCQYGSAVVFGGSNSGWDFFVSQIRPRWLKVFGGSAHAQGSLLSNVPSGNVFIADFSGDGPEL